MKNILNKIKTYNRYKKNNVNPYNKIRYAKGLGDFVACILHSKYIGPITYIITNNYEPCPTCNQRRWALNILFPIPFWKFFFKSLEELENDMENFYKKHNLNFEEIKNVEDSEISNFEKSEKTININDIQNNQIIKL